MCIKNRGIRLTGVIVFSLMVAAAFLATNAVVRAEDNDDYGTRHEVVPSASSAEEASQISGYVVKLPGWTPAGFVQDSITVPQLLVAEKGPQTRPVEIEWVAQDGSWIHMVQLPGLHSFPSGQSMSVAGVNGVKIQHEAALGRPSLTVFYWQDTDRSFSLGGTMTELLKEEDLLKMAASVGD